jgi:hypothetical protein
VAQWKPASLPSGVYDVYAWWPSRSSQSTNIEYSVVATDGSHDVFVNQADATSWGQWNKLGTFTLSFATAAVRVTSLAGQDAAADAVRFVATGAAPPSVTVASIVVTPDSTSIATQTSATFTAVALDASGAPLVATFAWAATGGTIDASGHFLAGATPGTFSVTATTGTISKSAVVVVAAPPMAGALLVHGPYLQGTARSQVSIVWATTTATDSVVEWGAGTTLTATASGVAGVTTHVVTITGLTAGAHYVYRVLVNGQPATLPAAFAAAAPPGTPFTVLMFGDSGQGSPDQFALAARMAQEKFDFIIHTGDVVYPEGQASGYDPYFFSPYGKLLATHPIYPTIGNHDYYDPALGGPFKATFFPLVNNPQGSKVYYSYEWGDAKFINIDDWITFAQPGPPFTWLENELATNTRRWLIVYMHAPLYSDGSHGDSANLQSLLQPLFEKYKVDLLFAGHDHVYERGGPVPPRYYPSAGYKGFSYIVTGGGGAYLGTIVAPHPFTLYTESSFHYVVLTFGFDSIQGKVVHEDGSIAETFVFNHQ